MNAVDLGPVAQSTRLVVELHPGVDLRAYVEGEVGQTPILCLETDVVSLLIAPDGPAVCQATTAAVEAIAAAAIAFRDQLCRLAEV